ncbi:hypothetical protein H0H92_006385 [Tricholoma furcatifolium]|nr:hypothetical protein H0H92_006385 [Tricholoma furcatifolium]
MGKRFRRHGRKATVKPKTDRVPLSSESGGFRFPPEIEDLIFKMAAKLNPRHAPTLSIISKRIQKCVEHVIYESIYVSPDCFPAHPENARPKRLSPTLSSRPAEFFETHVCNLYMYFSSDVPIDFGKAILSKCTSLKRLVLFQNSSSIIGSGRLLESTYTLSWLYTDKSVLLEMVESEIELPNLSFLGLHHTDLFKDIPSLDCFPALKKVELDFYENPALPEYVTWKQDIETVLSTTAQLQLLRLCAKVKYGCIEDVKEYIDERETPLPPGVEIVYYTIRGAGYVNHYRRWMEGS